MGTKLLPNSCTAATKYEANGSAYRKALSLWLETNYLQLNGTKRGKLKDYIPQQA